MSNENILKIKELNTNIIAPSTRTMNDPDQGGSKIVVCGKPGCFAPGTKVLKYDGDVINVEDVKIGDKLMGDDSTSRNVLELCNNFDEMFEIIPKSGEKYIVNKLHKLVLISVEREKGEKIIEITVEDYLNKTKDWQERWAVFRVPVEFGEQKVDIEPYILGLWLGNRTSNIHKEFSFLNALRSNNLLNNKHIPHKYKANTRSIRLELLAGIIDNNGNYDTRDNCFDIIQESKQLSDDITFITRTLGFTATQKEIIKSYNYEGEINSYYRITISGNIDTIPCRIIRTQEHTRKRNLNNLISRFSVISKGKGEYYGFTIDNNHRFLLSTCDVVRNTGKTTLIASLLYSKRDIFPVGMVMSGSEDSNGFYRKIMPSTFVYNEYNEDKIKDFIRRQKIAKQHLPNPWAVILLDDCTDDPRIFNNPLQHGMYKRGRHWKMWYILSLQYAMDVKPVIRTNVDGIFILREPILKNRKTLWENYASIIPDFHLFCEIMDQITDDYTALYIHNANHSNNWLDCVFWYKADIIPKDFKFGSPEFWSFHNDRYNPEYVDPFTC